MCRVGNTREENILMMRSSQIEAEIKFFTELNWCVDDGVLAARGRKLILVKMHNLNFCCDRQL